MSGLQIVFAGTPEFTLPCLEALKHSSHHLKAVYTQPDRPAGRGRHLQESAVKIWANTHHIPVFQPPHFKEAESVHALESLKPDVLVVIAYGLILPSKVLSIPRLGCINVHASLLPKWRGASPIQHALWYGDEETGVTIMQMDKGMDTGPLYQSVPCAIHRDTAGELHDRLSHLAVAPLLATLLALSKGHAKTIAQDNQDATYAPKITKENAAINWNKSATEIDQLIRAFNPWPIAHTLAEEVVLRVHQARVLPNVLPATPGTILRIDKEGVLVATGKDALLLERIQFPGGKVLSVSDWLNAKRSQLHLNLVLQ